MANNWAYLIWVGITAFLCNACGGKRTELVLGKEEQRTTPFWAIVIFASVALGSAFRAHWEGDTGTYKAMFEQCPSTLSELTAYLQSAERDLGYVTWEIVFKSIWGDNFSLFIAINAIFSCFFLVKVYRKYSCSYIMSIFLFVAGFEYYQWLYNGMRQCMAVCIAFNCIEDIINKRYTRIILPFTIAALLHMSVLIIVPCLFFVQGKAYSNRICLFALGLLAVGLALARAGLLNGLIIDMMENTQYDSVIDEFYLTMESGVNYLRVLVYMVPCALALFGLRYIREADDPVINFCTNMSIISACIYIISMFTSAVMIGRLPIYFSIYNYILLPWEIFHIFEKRSARLMTTILVICYLFYNYYQVVGVYNVGFNFGFLSLR